MREVSNGQLVGTGPEGPGRTATNPSPVRAQQPCMCHGWSLMALRVRNWEISMMVMESFMSCLLAKMRMEASRRACGQRNPAPVSLPGPSIPSHYPMSPLKLSCFPSKTAPCPGGQGWRPCPTVTTTWNDTNSSWRASQPAHRILTMIPGGGNWWLFPLILYLGKLRIREAQ